MTYTYEQLKKKERLLKDIVLGTLLITPLIVLSLTGNPTVAFVVFGFMLIPAYLKYAVIVKHFDDLYTHMRYERLRNIPRDEDGKFRYSR